MRHKQFAKHISARMGIIFFSLVGCALPVKDSTPGGSCGNGGCVAEIPLGYSGLAPDSAMPRSPKPSQLAGRLPSIRLEPDASVPLPADTSAISESGAVDREGRLHFFLTVQKPHEWARGTFTTLYFVDDRKGIALQNVSREISESGAPTILLSNDRKLHAFIADDPGKTPVVGDGELVLTKAPSNSPTSPCALAGRDLVCGYLVEGPKKGGKVRWELVIGIVGVPGGALPFLFPLPYRQAPDQQFKVVVAREAAGAWAPFAILDPLTSRGAERWKLAGDRAGNVHVLYTDRGKSWPTLAYSLIESHPPASSGQPVTLTIPPEAQGHTLYKGEVRDFDLAVDPASSSVQIAYVKDADVVAQSIFAGQAGPSSVLAQNAFSVRLASAGEAGFHTLIATADGHISYCLIGHGQVSGLVDIGNWSNAYRPGFISENSPSVFAIVPEPSGNAFAIWDSHLGDVRIREIILSADDPAATQNHKPHP